jgi:hypothetical protein
MLPAISAVPAPVTLRLRVIPLLAAVCPSIEIAMLFWIWLMRPTTELLGSCSEQHHPANERETQEGQFSFTLRLEKLRIAFFRSCGRFPPDQPGTSFGQRTIHHRVVP